jgi:hypothetical protein
MELRNYPLMSFRSLRNWPPNWAWIEGAKKARVSGEVGRLVKIVPSLLEDGPLFDHGTRRKSLHRCFAF